MSSLFSNTKNTRSIIQGCLKYIRSDVPVRLTDDEINWLLENNITTIIDLRTTEEQNRKKCPLESISGFDYHKMAVSSGDVVPESVDKVSDSYINMVDAQMNDIIATIMNADSNVLYFCNAGKDRTGVVSAIILCKLGYDDEYIIRDYLQSADNLHDVLNAYAENNPKIDINVITPTREYIQKLLQYLDENNII